MPSREVAAPALLPAINGPIETTIAIGGEQFLFFSHSETVLGYLTSFPWDGTGNASQAKF